MCKKYRCQKSHFGNLNSEPERLLDEGQNKPSQETSLLVAFICINFQVFSIATSSGFDLPKTDFTNKWAIKPKKKKIETDMTNKAAKPKKKVSKKVTKTPKMVKAFIRRK